MDATGYNTMSPDAQQRINDAYRTFFHSLQQNDLQAILRIAYEFTGYPVNFTDEHYRLIYQYPQEKMGEEIWDTLYDDKVLAPDVLADWLKMYLNIEPDSQNNVKTYSPFYVDWGLAEKSPRIFAEVFYKKRIFGHLALFTRGACLREEDLAVTQIIVDAIQVHMSSTSSSLKSPSSLIADLLDPETTLELKKQSGEILRSRLGRHFLLIVMSTHKTTAQSSFSSYISDYLMKKYKNVIVLIYHDNIVILIGKKYSCREEIEMCPIIQEIRTLAGRMFLHGGIAKPFEDLAAAREKYWMALLTAQLTTSELVYYEDLVPAQIYKLITMATPSDTFLHPALELIRQYDINNNTEYFITLQGFFANLFDKEATAKSLNIHRNTLVYRLTRIEQLFNLDYKESSTARWLFASFELWNIISK